MASLAELDISGPAVDCPSNTLVGAQLTSTQNEEDTRRNLQLALFAAEQAFGAPTQDGDEDDAMYIPEAVGGAAGGGRGSRDHVWTADGGPEDSDDWLSAPCSPRRVGVPQRQVCWFALLLLSLHHFL